MAAKSRQFPDEMDDSQDDIGMSDADLEALMGGASAPSPGKTIDVDKLEPGDRLEGNVIDIRAGEVLLELDGKHHGLIEEDEFEEDEELPLLGTRIKASVIRYDGARRSARPAKKSSGKISARARCSRPWSRERTRADSTSISRE